jgi:hypothetical protein
LGILSTISGCTLSAYEATQPANNTCLPHGHPTTAWGDPRPWPGARWPSRSLQPYMYGSLQVECFPRVRRTENYWKHALTRAHALALYGLYPVEFCATHGSLVCYGILCALEARRLACLCSSCLKKRHIVRRVSACNRRKYPLTARMLWHGLRQAATRARVSPHRRCSLARACQKAPTCSIPECCHQGAADGFGSYSCMPQPGTR